MGRRDHDPESFADGANPTDEEAPEGRERLPGEIAAEDLVRIPIEDVLDLHSFQPKEIASVVEEYLEAARRAGFHEVRIIHGRGVGVQREVVRAILARTPFVVSFGDAPPGAGGWGATLVRLRIDGPGA